MSGIINLLPDSIANQIAAGEVIQRPASVVKELLENALDAQATSIQLIIKDAGKTLIQVVDDGIGMAATDARLCFERHATSKIKTSDDLFHISSFGFRGEALASIAAVAHVELRTKRKEDQLGTHIVVEGSTVKKQEPCQVSSGSSFVVRNLFYNVPARRKFLKSDPVELKHIVEEFARIALANPEVFFSLHHNGNELYHFPKSNLRQRIVNFFGKNTNEKIVPVEEDTDFLSIRGFIGRPEFIRKTRGDQFIFVNRRFIKSNYLNHAIKVAYENLIPQDHYPFFVLLLDIDPAMIDINIHPTKQEVKFENERLVYNFVRVGVKHTLGKYSIVPTLDFDSVNTAPVHPVSQNKTQGSWSPVDTPHPGDKKAWMDFYEDLQKERVPESSEKIILSSDWEHVPATPTANTASSSHKCFQIHNGYIISPIKSGVLVIDQQAAHERILYEKYLEMLRQRKVGSQKTLFPETIHLSESESKLLEEILTDLTFMGFSIERFGNQSYVVNSMPSEITVDNAVEFVRSFIHSYAANQEFELSVVENIARSMALNSSIKRGQDLTHEEMVVLIDKLFACQMPYSSPSGKKCFITFGLDELQSRFNT